MNIYLCKQIFREYLTKAIVQANTEDDAVELLGWQLGENITSIDVILIEEDFHLEEKVLCMAVQKNTL